MSHLPTHVESCQIKCARPMHMPMYSSSIIYSPGDKGTSSYLLGRCCLGPLQSLPQSLLLVLSLLCQLLLSHPQTTLFFFCLQTTQDQVSFIAAMT